MLRAIKVTFHLDGTGIYYDPCEPLMLDGLLAAAVCRWHVHGEPPSRDEEPFDVPLPLARWWRDGVWGWHASALFPDGADGESVQYWRKRLRQGRIEVTTGSPNTTNGPYRDWNNQLPLLLTPRMVGYAVGDMRQVRRELRRNVRYLGKKRAHGRGAIVGVEVEEMPQDWSIARDGRLTRWMPMAHGSRLVRPRPPYWNTVGRIACGEIGDECYKAPCRK